MTALQEIAPPSHASLVGVVDPGPDVPGFMTPVFRDKGGGYYFANSSSNLLQIDGFCPADVEEDEIVHLPEKRLDDYRAGDLNLFAFRDAHGTIHAGSRRDLTVQLRRLFSGLNKFPFTQLEIAGFLNQPRFLAEAIRRSIVVEIGEDSGSVRQALQDLIGQFDIDESFARGVLALDFAKALLTYYRLFNRLIHVADLPTRRRLTYRFRAATDNIVPFLLDESIIEALPVKGRAPLQARFPGREFATTPPEFSLQLALKRIGASSAVAERFATRATRSGEDREDKSVPPSTAVTAAHAIESLRTLSFREAYKRYAIDRLDKKHRKRQLDAEFMDLTLGLALVLSHELRTLVLSAEDYISVRTQVEQSVRKFGEYSTTSDAQRRQTTVSRSKRA